MKKKLNTTTITNELAGGSAFFVKSSPSQEMANKPVSPPPPEKPVLTKPEKNYRAIELSSDRPKEPKHKWKNAHSNERYNERTNVVTNKRINERRKIRHTFDIFADQLYSLKEVQLKRELELESNCRLGDLVQEAIDQFLEQERGEG